MYNSNFFVGVFLFLTLTVNSFLAWNFFGLLFLYNGVYLFFILKKYRFSSFFKFSGNILLFITSWMLGAYFWTLEIQHGIYALMITIILTMIPFCFLYIIFLKYKKASILMLIPVWLLYEIYNNFTSLSFPWFTIGNVFSTNLNLVQWYKLTGVFGGTIWFLLLSYFLFRLILDFKIRNIITLSLIFIFPISMYFLSNILTREPSKEKIYKTFVTFNNAKMYDKLSKDELAFYILNKTKNISGKNKILLIPETTFRGENIDKFKFSNVYKFLKRVINENDFKEVFYGTSIFKPENYIANSSFFLTNDRTYVKSKRKLIIFNEYVPKIISKKLNIKKYYPNSQDDSSNITKKTGVLPLICYEAFYSYFVINKNNNADIIYLLSSEIFFNDSKFGKLQYNNILKLRCIENNLPLIKASNGGETLFINSKGKVLFSSQKEINIFEIKT